MSWTNPRTWGAAEIVTAAKMNEIRDSLRSSGGDRTTSVPGSPNDQDELNYPADTANGVVWRFKYNAGSASSFKWEFIGGAPMFASVATDESTASTTYVDLATVGPSITLPRAGDYEVSWHIAYWNATGNTTGYSAVKRGAAAAVDADAATSIAQSAAPGFSTSRVGLVLAGMAASDVVKLQHRVTSGTGHFLTRSLSVRPIRVS